MEEVVAKKRGRPRKNAATEIHRVAQTTSSEEQVDIITSEPRPESKTASARSRITRRSTKRDSTMPAIANELSTVATRKRKIQSKIGSSPILDQAKAFSTTPNLRNSDAMSGVDTAKQRLTENEAQTATESLIQYTNSSPTGQTSSFLTSFLDNDYKEPISQRTESDFVSDREAFKKTSQPSIDEIIKGDGITNLSTLSRTEQTTTRDRFKPQTIPSKPRKPVKIFQGHGLRAFPDQRQGLGKAKVMLNIPPEIYGAKSFKALKGTGEVAVPVMTEASVRLPPHTASETSPSEQSDIRENTTIHQTFASTQMRQAAQSTSTILSSASTLSATSTSIAPRPPVRRPPPPPPPPSESPYQPRFPSRPVADTPPKKLPTQMTAKELLRDPKFRQTRRRWTTLIVGIPVLLVTSLEVYKRFGDMTVSEDVGVLKVEGVRRHRGEMPGGGILSDGALRGSEK